MAFSQKLEMKYFIIIILFQITELPTFGQCDESLIGDWRVISCFNGEVYFNLKNDSTFLTPEMKELYPDSTSQWAFIQAAKDIYGSLVYHYAKDGTFIITAEAHYLNSGKYCFIPSDKVVLETTKNSLGKEVVENVNARLENDLLYLSKKWEEDKKYNIVLEKVTK